MKQIKIILLAGVTAIFMTGCISQMKWIEFPYSDGAGLPDEKTGRLTWDWMGRNIKLNVDGKLVFVNGPYAGPDFQKKGTAAEYVRLLPGIHTINYYVYRQDYDEPMNFELTFEVEAGHNYRVYNGACSIMSGRGTAWIEETKTKKIVAKDSNCFDLITASNISPLTYEKYSCNQLKDEVLKVNKRLAVIQADIANTDATSMAVGLTFWPALFLMPQDDEQKGEISSLKGQYDTIRDVASKKNCDFASGM